MPRPSVLNPVAVRWWIAAAFFAFAMAFGGGARPDLLSNVWLRPIAIVVLVYAAFGVRGRDWRSYLFLVAMAAAITVLTVAHLIPLPPAIWQALPGRELVADIDRAVDLEGNWRPLSLVPSMTWNALYSLSVPVAALLLLLPMDERQLFGLLKVIAAMLILSALIGLFQASGGSLSFYNISNPNAGLFANRNHQAVLLACLYPIAAVLASEPGVRAGQRKLRWIAAIVLGLSLAPLLMVTGSRAGIAAAALAIISLPFVVNVSWRGKEKRSLSRLGLAAVVFGGAMVLALGWMAFEGDRNLVLLRFTELDATEDLRYPVWAVTWDLAQRYLPLGSGIGSFVEVFQVGEPDRLLMPQYWNHAHNDWLETTLAAGVPGMLLMAAAVLAWVVASWRAFIIGKAADSAIMLARMGCVMLAILGLASVFDYPVRTPAAVCVFVFAAVLATNWKRSPHGVR